MKEIRDLDKVDKAQGPLVQFKILLASNLSITNDKARQVLQIGFF